VKFLCLGNRSIRRNHVSASKPSWMMPISHGHHVVEHDMIKDDSDDSEFDSVVIQREQIGETELWYFGIFDALIGDCVTKYLQSNYFDKNLKEVINCSKLMMLLI
jgi:protein phosphatase PTC1